MPNLILLTAPTLLPITAEQVMASAFVEDEEELEKFQRLIRTATELVQDFSGFQLLRAEYRLDLPRWPGDTILLPRSNGVAVSQIQYRPASGGPLTLWDASQYQVVSKRRGVSEVSSTYNHWWPSLAWQSTDAVQVTYSSGSLTIEELPPHAVTAVEQLALHLYEHPSGSCDIPPGIQTLIRSFSIRHALLDQQMAMECL